MEFARRFRKFLDANNMDESNVLESVTNTIFTTNGEHSARPKDNDLIGVVNVIGIAAGNMNSEWPERLTSNKFDQIIRSHDEALSIH